MRFIKLFFALFITFNFHPFCHSQDITFNSQADVDFFDPTTTIINGNLHIGTSSISDITDLSNLSNLTAIEGDLFIFNNDDLTNINALSALLTIGGILHILGNYSLRNVDGLVSLTSIGESLWITNGGLENLDGLGNLTSVGYSLAGGTVVLIYRNGLLSDCCGIQNLLSTPGSVNGGAAIYFNPSECSSVTEVLEADCTTSSQDYQNQKESPYIMRDIGDKYLITFSDEIFGEFNWQVISMQGKLINSGSILGSKELIISKNELKPGVYLMILNIHHEVHTIKLLVSH